MTDAAPPTESGDTQDVAQLDAKPSVRLTLIGLAIGLFGPVASFLLIRRPLRAAGFLDSVYVRAAVGLSLDWIIVIALLVFVVRVEHQPLRSVGFRRPKWTELATTPLWWILSTLLTVGAVLVLRDHLNPAADRALRELPLGIRIAMVLTAPFFEEIVYRGYLIERIGALTGRLWVAGAISAVLFAAAHIPYYGLVEGLVRLPVAIVLVVRYIRRRSLAPVFALHFAVDLVVLLI